MNNSDEINSIESEEHTHRLDDLTSTLQNLVTSLQHDQSIHDKRTFNITRINQPNFKPDKFQPSLKESPSIWLSKFKSWIAINKYEDVELIQHSLRLLIPDSDLPWIDGLKCASLDELYDAFLQHFQAKQPHWLLEQTLWSRIMQPGEDLERYISDIESLSHRLNKTDAEKMSSFVRGLPGYIRANVVQKDPKTYQEATKVARLCHEAHQVTGASPSQSDISQILIQQQASIEALTKLVLDKEKSKEVSVCATSRESTPRVICQYCDKPNHMAKECWKLKNRSRRQCEVCKMSNHMTKDCRKLRQQIARDMQPQQEN